VRILSGVFEGVTTGADPSCMIENTDQRSKGLRLTSRTSSAPGHGRITYFQKYGIRDLSRRRAVIGHVKRVA